MSANPTPIRFEDALRELDGILRDLEDGAVSLEDSLARYERGVGLLRLCWGQLKEAEQKVKMLTGTAEDGRPLLESFEHSSSMEAAPAANRKRKEAGTG
jgi:exodeoxyribonuclease VII small subunit